MSKKILYAMGDSFVFGMECIEKNPKGVENKDLAFPKYIADKLACKTYINNSICGATNPFTFRTTLFDLKELEESGVNPKDVFVIVGITSLHRIEVNANAWHSQVPNEIKRILPELAYENMPPEARDYGIFFINPGSPISFKEWVNLDSPTDMIVPIVGTYIWHENVMLPQLEAQIFALHEYLKSKGYAHVFVNTVFPLHNTKYIDVSCKNFYKLDTDCFFLTSKEKWPEEHRPQNHFSTVAHAGYAEELFKYIQENCLL